jgi:hypothetical protein
MQTTNKLNVGKVYVIEAVGLNRYKIGFTNKTLEDRLYGLQSTKQCVPYRKLFESEPLDNAYQLEQSIHKQFEEFRVHGEWFELNKDQLTYVIQTIQGSFLHYYCDQLNAFLNSYTHPHFENGSIVNYLVSPFPSTLYKVDSDFTISLQVKQPALTVEEIKDFNYGRQRYSMGSALVKFRKQNLTDFPTRLKTQTIAFTLSDCFEGCSSDSFKNELVDVILYSLAKYELTLGTVLPDPYRHYLQK